MEQNKYDDQDKRLVKLYRVNVSLNNDVARRCAFPTFSFKLLPATRRSNFATLHDNAIKKKGRRKVNRLG